jgi:acyl-CoA thioester hydrolase
MNKQPQNSTIIRFQDCDPHGHLNNAQYINYMMNAREDHLLEYYNYDIFKFTKEQHKTWVISKNEILYKYPTFVMEKVCIRSQLLDFNNKQVKLEICMFDENMQKIKSLLWSTFIFFDLGRNRVVHHTEDLISLFESIVLPIKCKTIEERIKEIL